MERSNIIKRIKSKTTTIDLFNYDSLSAPPLLSLLSYEDIEYFRRLATSIRYSGKIDYKYSEIDKVMKSRGFVKMGAGTNRVVYRHLEIDTIVVKIAIDAVGVKDNPREYENQFYLKPYCTKVFEVSPCGTVGIFERGDQINSREEFQSVATEVFDLLSNWIIGKYIMEDIGSKYFMNYCIRPGFGPILCDFPYLYELDGNKLYCRIPDDYGILCDGVIDYDKGFNHLYCSKCGAKYKAIELKKAIENKLIINIDKENNIMNNIKIVAKVGNKIIKEKDFGKETRKYESRRDKKYRIIKQNNPIDSIKVVTSKQKEEEKVVTKVEDIIEDMNKLPEWERPVNEAGDEVYIDLVSVEEVEADDVVEVEDESHECKCENCTCGEYTEDFLNNKIITEDDIVESVEDDILEIDIDGTDINDGLLTDEIREVIDNFSKEFNKNIKKIFEEYDTKVYVDMTLSIRTSNDRNLYVEEYDDEELMSEVIDEINESIDNGEFDTQDDIEDDEDKEKVINEEADPDDSYNDEDDDESFDYNTSSFIPQGKDDSDIPVGVVAPNYNNKE